MNNILVATGDVGLQSRIQEALLDTHRLFFAANAEQVLAQLGSGEYTSAIFDTELPGNKGDCLLIKVRSNANEQLRRMLVMMLSECIDSTKIEEILYFREGADAVTLRSASSRVLRARVDALLRRSYGNPRHMEEGTKILERDGIKMKKMTFECSVQNKPLYITVTEWKILWHFLSHPTRVCSRDNLIAIAYQKYAGESRKIFVDERTIDSHIKRLRRKFEAVKEELPVQALYGLGYRYMHEDKKPIKNSLALSHLEEFAAQ